MTSHDDTRPQPGAYLQDIRGTLFVSNTFAYVPKPLLVVIKNLPIPVVRQFVGTAHRIRQTGRQLIATYRAQEAEGKGLPNGTIFDHFVSAKGDKLVMTESQREAEGRSLLIAGRSLVGNSVARRSSLWWTGTDTTSITLTYIISAVLKDNIVCQKILKELADHGLVHADDSDNFNVSFEQASGMPYIHAVVQEGLRLYGAALGRLPRVVPPGGDTLSGKHLPAGTVVSPQAYTVHRNAEAFPDPER